MDTIRTIMERRSVREYTDAPISEASTRVILEAGMSGPSCVNSRDWAFVVIKEPQRLKELAATVGHTARMVEHCQVAILVCGDTKLAFEKAPDYWVIDGAIAGQNMTLAAKGLGIGSVWLGIWPQMDRVERLKEFFNLPTHIVPHSLFAFGYPIDDDIKARDVFQPDKIHYEKW